MNANVCTNVAMASLWVMSSRTEVKQSPLAKKSNAIINLSKSFIFTMLFHFQHFLQLSLRKFFTDKTVATHRLLRTFAFNMLLTPFTEAVFMEVSTVKTSNHSLLHHPKNLKNVPWHFGHRLGIQTLRCASVVKTHRKHL